MSQEGSGGLGSKCKQWRAFVGGQAVSWGLRREEGTQEGTLRSLGLRSPE